MPQNGNNGNGGGGNNAVKRRRRNQKMMKRAKRQVRIANAPILNEIKQQRQQNRNAYQTANERTADIYAGLQNELAGFAPQYDQLAQGIVADSTARLGTLEGLIGPGQSPQEAAAMSGAIGTIGAANLGTLQADRMRNANYFQSQQGVAAIQKSEVQMDNLRIMRQLDEELKRARMQNIALHPQQILERFDQLRDERNQLRLARGEQQIRQDLADRELDLMEKKNRQGNRRKNQQTAVVVDAIQDEQTKATIAQQLKRLNNILGTNLPNRIEDVFEKYRKQYGNTLTQQNGKWGYITRGGRGYWIPLPEMNQELRQLRQRKNRLQERRRKLRKKKRNA